MSRKHRSRAQRLRDRKIRRNLKKSQFRIEALDARILLDASDVLVAGFSDPGEANSEVAKPREPQAALQNAPLQIATGTSQPSSDATGHPMDVAAEALRNEIVFVDEGVEQSESLTSDLLASRPGVIRHIVPISSETDGLAQIAEAMESFRNVNAIHIVSHGSAGQIHLGQTTITTAQLDSEHAETLRTIGSRLSPDGDVLFYGCDLAADNTDDGNDFVSRFSALTGADVAASNDVTGPESLGGDWELEVTIGQVESVVTFSPAMQETFPTTLDIIGFSAAIGSDGTPTFDPADTPGNDTGPNNNRVRSHDIVTFNVDLGVSATGAANPHISSTLPEGLVWDVLPAIATGADSGIFDSVTGLPDGDMRSIVVHLADISGALSTSFPLQARALGVQDGTMANGTKFVMESDDLATPLESAELDLEITSAPNMDIRLLSPRFRGIWPNAAATEEGAVYTYSIGVFGSHPTRTGADAFKGAAPISEDFTFDIDLSGVSANAEIYSWGSDLNQGGYYGSGDGIRRNYELDPVTGRWGWGEYWRPSGRTADNGSTHSYFYPESSTPDSGDFQVTTPGAPGGTYGVTVTGSDTSGPLPKYGAAGHHDYPHYAVPAGEAWFISGVVDVFIPVDDILPGADGILGTPDDGSLVVAPEIINFDPDDFWGNLNNFGGDGVGDTGTEREDTSNNSYSHTVLAHGQGGPSKALYQYGSWTYEQTQSYYHAGDGKTSIGHKYDVGIVTGTNNGILPTEGFVLGEKIDNTATRIAPNSPYGSTPMVSGSNWVRAYQAGGTGPKASTWLQHGTDFIIEFGIGGVGGAPGGWTDWQTMGQATVADSESPVWTQDPGDPALGGTVVDGVSDAITKYRVKTLIDLEPGAYIIAWVTQETIGRSTLDLAADPTGDFIADQIAITYDRLLGDPADPSDDVWYVSDYNPLTNMWYPVPGGNSTDIYYGDRLRFVDAQVRIDKQIVDTGTGNNFLGGAIATFQLDATVTIPGVDTGDPAGAVVVQDILPGGLTVVPGSVTPNTTNGNPVEYCIVCDDTDWTAFYPTSGLAKGLRWTYGDVPLNTTLPTTTFDVLMPFDAPSGTQYQNSATISSTSDPSPVVDRDSFAGLTVVQLAALSVGKTAITPLVPEDGTMIFEIGVANVSDDKVIPYIDVVDLLPWDGDEDDSAFDGSFVGIDVPVSDPGLEFYVSTVAPLTLDTQDGAIDGFADPGTPSASWYEAVGTSGGQFEFTLADVIAGAAGAPAPSAVTAIRVVSDSTFDRDNPYLDSGESASWRLALTPSQNNGIPSDVYVNDVIVRTDPGVLTEPTTSGPATITVVAPDIDLTKEICVNEFGPCDPTEDSHWASSTVFTDDPTPSWRITVENTGTSDLPTVTVTDPIAPTGMTLVAGSVNALSGDVSGFLPTWTLALAPGASSYLAFDTELDATPDVAAFENSASVAAADQFGQAVSDNDDASIQYLPEIGVSKEQVSVVRNATDPAIYDVKYRVVFANTGLVTLDELELSEDLHTAFGSGYVGVGTPPPTIVSSTLAAGDSLPLFNVSWNGNLNGAGDAELFNGTTGVLSGGSSFTVEYVVQVEPNLLPDPANETNQVTATSNGGTATDVSDDGNDPDGDNPGAPGDLGTTDDPTPLRIPLIELEKQIVGTPAPANSGVDGNFDVTYQFVIENTGTVDLQNVLLDEDFVDSLGGAFVGVVQAPVITASTATNDPGINAAYDGGTTDEGVLDPSDNVLLEPGQTVTIQISVEVDPDAQGAIYDGVTGDGNGDLENQASVSGSDFHEGTVVRDLSDDPTDTTDADPDGDGDPDDSTGLILSDIGISKEVVGTPVQIANGNWTVEYQLVVENTGAGNLTNLQINENLEAELGAGTYVGLLTSPAITSGTSLPGSVDPVLDASWDGGLSGSGNDTILNGGSGVLVPTDSLTIRFTVEVDLNATGTATTLSNQADASGSDGNGDEVTDDSDSGSDPNSNNSGNPGDTGGADDPTPLEIPAISGTKEVSGAAIDNGNGTWTVPYEMTLANTGTVILNNPTWVDNIQSQHGAAFVGTNNVMLDSSGVVGGTAPALEATTPWDGTAAGNILDGTGTLDPGDRLTLTFDVVLDASAFAVSSPLTNQATVGGTPDSGDPVSDLSDDGDDAYGNNPGSPGDKGTSNDPTPVIITDLDIAKSIRETEKLVNGNAEVTYSVVITNNGTVSLSDLTVIEDAAAQIGTNFITGSNLSVAVAPSNGNSAVAVNTGWDGTSTNSELMAGGSTLAAGDSFTIEYSIEVDVVAMSSATAPARVFYEEAGFAAATGATIAEDFQSIVGDNSETLPYTSPSNVVISGTVISNVGTGTETREDADSFSGMGPDDGNFTIRQTAGGGLANLRITVPNPGTSIGFGWSDVFDPIGGLPAGAWSAIKITASDGTVLYEHDERVDGDLPGDVYRFAGIQGDGSTVYTHVDIEYASNGNDNWFIDHIYGGGTTASSWSNQLVGYGKAVDENGDTIYLGSHVVGVSDVSDSGSSTTSTNPGEPGDNGTYGDPTPLAIPCVHLAKQVNGPYVNNGDGTWTIPYQLVLENSGTASLANPSIVDNIQTQLGGTVFESVSNVAVDTSGVMGGTAPGLNGGWNGTTDVNILNGTGTLASGDVVVVTFDLLVHGTELARHSPLTNQATASGEGPDGLVSDLSDDGDDPTSDNPGSPGDDGMGGTDDPTPILIPQIGLAKEVIGNPTQLANGNWSVGYQLTLQNTGTVDLDNLQLSENLEIEFGSDVFVGILTSPSITSPPALPGSLTPVLDPSWDAGLRGSPDINIFNGTSGNLVPGDILVVQFAVEVNPDATGTSSALTNQAEASGTGPNGTPTTDVSDDGSNPNGTNPGEDGDMGTSNDPTPLEIPEIGAAKQVNNTTEIATGVYDVQYAIVIENTGSADLFNLQLHENLAAEFGAGFAGVQVAPTITASTAAVDPTFAAWNGTTTAPDFFDGTSGHMLPGQSLTVQFTIRLDANLGDTTAPMDYSNQVQASGEDAGGTRVTDDSDDGTNPNTDNGAGGPDDRSSFQTAQIRAVKTYGTIVNNSDGTYTVPVIIAVENTGTADLHDLTLSEDIASEFGNAFVRVANAQISSVGTYNGALPTVNPGWVNDTSLDVINPGQSTETLLAGESYQFTFDVVVDPDAVDDQSQPLMNQAKAAGVGTNFDGSQTMVMDESGYPNILNPDGTDSDNPAVLNIPEIRTAKVVTGVVANGDNWNVTFDLVLENTGSTNLSGVDLFDDLTSQMGAQFVGVVSATMDDTTGIGTSVAPTLNFGGTAGATPFDGGASGAGSDNLLNNDGNLVPGEWITVTLTITVDPDATGVSSGIQNQATGAADGPDGEVTDTSDYGTNPNSNNPDSPGDTGGHDDSTTIALPDISITKEVVGTPTQLANGNFSVTYHLVQENTGTVDLINLQITEDLETEFGVGVFVRVIAAPSISNGPNLTGSTAPSMTSWDGGVGGSTNTVMFNGTNGRLVPGDSIEVQFTVEIDPDALGTSTPLDNQVATSATGVDENGDPIGPVTDDSDSGTNPNTDNPGAPGDTGATDDPTPLAIPDIRVTKAVSGSYVNHGDGTWTIPFSMILKNTGTTDLDRPTWIDNVRSQLTPAVFAHVSNVALDTAGVVGGTAPGLSGAWNGTTSGNMLDGTGTLTPGDFVAVTFDVTVNEGALAANSPLTNQSTGFGTGPDGAVSDASDDGDDPHGNNPSAPGDLGTTDDPTPIQIPRVGLAKQVVGTPTKLANGNYSVVYELLLQNLGTVDLQNLQIAEDLEAEFGTGVFVGVTSTPSVVDGPNQSGSVAPTFVVAWDGGLSGSTNTDLFTGTTGLLKPNDSLTIRFTVEVDPDATGASTPLENTAQAYGEDENGTAVTDDSDDATDPIHDTDTPTPLEIPEIRTVKQVSGSATDNGDGTYTIPYELSVENTGSSDLTSLTWTDNVRSQLGAAVFIRVSNVSLDSAGVLNGTAPGLSGTWTGTNNASILDGTGTLAPGDSMTLTFDLLVRGSALAASSPLTNQASVSGIGPNGRVQDASDDGTDVHGTNPNAPGDKGTTDDPTPILIPDIAIAKSVLGTPDQLANDNYSVKYQLVLQNTGTIDLLNLQITEDLETEFGVGAFVGIINSPSIVNGPSISGSIAPVVAAWSGGLGGSNNTGLFNGTSGLLKPNDSITVQFTVEIDPDASGASTQLDNQANAYGEDEDGTAVTDASDSGTDPNSSNPGEPGDTGTPDDTTPLEIPEIRTVKKVRGAYVNNGNGTFTIPYELTIENTGSVGLNNLTWTDDIRSQLGTAVFVRVNNVSLDTTQVIGGTAPGLNGAWDGSDDANILHNNGTLAPGDSATVTFDLIVNGAALAANAPLTNQAEVSGDTPSGTSLTDLSDDGDDPHGDNPSAPGDMGTTDDPTPILIPNIGLAKQVLGTPRQLANGNFSVEYELVLQNLGTVNLINLQIAEDLETEFGSGVFAGVTTAPAIVSGPSSPGSNAPVFTAWDGGHGGSSNTDMFNGTSGLLVPNDAITVRFRVEVDPDAAGASSVLKNQADAYGEDETGTSVTDPSDSGTDPNSSNTGEPGDTGSPNDPTPLSFGDIGTTKNAVGLSANGENWDVTFDLVLENTGTTALTRINLLDDLATQLGPQLVSVVNVTIDTSNVTSGNPPTLNYGTTAGGNAFTGGTRGAASANLLNNDGTLVPGDYVTIQMTITVDPDATGASMAMENQTTAQGSDPTGTTVTDMSDAGTDPSGDNPSAPGDMGTSHDPTPIAIPDIGVSKEVATDPILLANGNFSVTYRMVVENIGSVNLTNIQLVDDLENELGTGVFLGVTSAPRITGGPNDSASIAPTVSTAFNGGLAGSTDTDVLNGTSGLLVPGDFIEVEFTIEVNPNAVGPGTRIANQATAEGESPDGTTVTDLSDDGDDPNGDNPSAPGHMGTSDDPTPLDLSDVGLAKEVIGSPVAAPTEGHYFVTYQLVIENTGNTTLTGLDLYDDVEDEFGAAYVGVESVPTIVANTMADPGNLPTTNTGWASNSLRSMFNDDGALEPGETITLQFVLELDSVAASGETMSNQAEVTSDDPFTGDEDGPSDLSDDGPNPDSRNPGSPGDTGTTDDPTPVRLPLPTDAMLEIEKTTTTVIDNVVTFTLDIENTSLAMANRIQIRDDLDAVFGAGNYTVNSTYLSTPPFAPTSSLTLNLNFNGGSGVTAGVQNNDLVNHTINNTLAPGDRAQIQVTLTVNRLVDQDGPGGMSLGDFANTVTLSNRGPDGTTFTDDGTDDVHFAPNATVGVAKDSVWDDENDTAIFNFYLEHFGNTVASNLSMTDNFDAIFGATNWTLTRGATVLSGPSTVTANPGFDGSSDFELIRAGSSLAPGETAQIQVALAVNVVTDAQNNGLGVFENQVSIHVEDSDGTPFTDTSTEGTDPDPSGDGDPSEEVISNGKLTADGTVGVAKEGTVSEDGRTATYDLFLQHYGNATAQDVTLTEDLDAVFGSGNYTVTSLALVSGPNTMLLNGAFNGNSNTQLLSDGSTMNPTETAQIQVAVSLTGAFGIYENQVELGFDTGGDRITEFSTTGTDPDPDGDGDPTNNGETTIIEVATGEILGFHYLDINNNGVFETDERGIPGVVVTLTGTDINGAPVEIVQTTLGDGSYQFVGLLPGDYEITQSHPEGFIDGRETPGTFGGTALNDAIEVSLINQSTFIAENYNFGERGLDPLAQGKDPFLASNQDNDADATQPANPDNIEPDDTSPLQIDGNRLTVRGTPQADSITVMAHAEEHRVIVNSVEYFVDADAISEIIIDGNTGADTIEIRGAHGDDTLTFTGRSTASLIGDGYSIDVQGGSTIHAYGGGGNDSVAFIDTAGKDEFLASPKFAQMSNAVFTHTARHFETVTATSTGGADRATLHGTSGDDTFVASKTQSSLRGDQFESLTSGFATVRAFAKGGNDTATLHDTSGNNILASHPHTTNLRGDGINFSANDFGSVTVQSTGGTDVAYLHGSDNDDSFVARPNEGQLTGQGFDNKAIGFSQIIAFGRGGSADKANLYDSAGNDVVVARPTSTIIRGNGYKNTVRDFDQVTSHSVQGGNDAATFVDSAGDDVFVAHADKSQLTGEGFDNIALGFKTVVANAQIGGTDSAILHDSSANDVFVSRKDKAVMRDDGQSYKNIANKFENVQAISTQGTDSAIFMDVKAEETVKGENDRAHVYGDRDHRADGFAKVVGNAKEGQTANSEVDNVDFLFSQFGDWG